MRGERARGWREPSASTQRERGTGMSYSGDVSPREAWDALQSNPDAQIVDVRTRPEWAFVGTPDLRGAGREIVPLEWQTYPSMQIDPGFADTLEAELARRGVPNDAPIYFLCRSGARSAAAASTLSARGRAAFNIAGGFEGNPDAAGHRGTVEGWKAEGLPWRQP